MDFINIEIKYFKQGDIVHCHNAKFLILENARSIDICTDEWKGSTYAAMSVCIECNNPNQYIEEGKEWLFQGNNLAGKYRVEM